MAVAIAIAIAIFIATTIAIGIAIAIATAMLVARAIAIAIVIVVALVSTIAIIRHADMFDTLWVVHMRVGIVLPLHRECNVGGMVAALPSFLVLGLLQALRVLRLSTFVQELQVLLVPTRAIVWVLR